MKLSSLEEYGLRCLVRLALADESRMNVPQIAALEGLSESNVEKLLWQLSHAGLTESTRGSKGGYRLSKPASAITLAEAMRALDGLPTQEAICDKFKGTQDACNHYDDCSLRPVWRSLTDLLTMMLDRVTLADLLQNEAGVEAALARARQQLRVAV